MTLNGKTALITGAAKGIGEAIARDFHAHGAKLILHYNNSEEAARELANTLDAQLIQADLSTPEGCEYLLNEIDGDVDILVNNAGMTRDMLTIQMNDDDWNSILSVNLTASFRLCRGMAQRMLQRRKGSIINITSTSGIRPNRGQANYAASKAALAAMTKSLAKEMAKRGIRCNCIAPGFIETDMTSAMNPAALAEAKKRIPMRRPGKPAEVAAVVRFLASDEASYVTGQEWIVDGGLIA